ncbi:MAG: inositol monophosphatase family protein, partial [Dehalococcoidia bacterium]
FTRGLPVWATLVAFERDGVVEVGVASAPALGTRWWAARGLGAYRGSLPAESPHPNPPPQGGRGSEVQGERIHVSEIATLAESHVLNGGMRYARRRWPAADRVSEVVWRDRGYGDFWAHCLVAEGAAEAMFEDGVSPWDVAALIVILEEAGGRLTSDTGVPGINHGHAVTSNGRVHDELLALLLG